MTSDDRVQRYSHEFDDVEDQVDTQYRLRKVELICMGTDGANNWEGAKVSMCEFFHGSGSANI